MRLIPVLMLSLALAGCELMETNGPIKPVDAATLAPLSSREQALIFGADGAFQQGNYVAAERDYLSAVAASTGHIDAHLALARLYDKQHFPEKQGAILAQALQLQPNHPLANYMIGKLHLEANQYARALEAFQRGRTTHPGDVDLAIGEAVTQDMMGRHAEAQRIYQRVMADNPNAKLGNVRTNLGMSYLLSGDAKKAVETLKIEAKKPDSSQVARHNLALAYGLLGRHADAKAMLNGELDEETRLLAIARMKEYLRERADDTAAPIRPTINEAAAPNEPAVAEKPAAKPAKAPVVNKPTPKPAKKPVVNDVKAAAPAKAASASQ